MGKHEVGTPKYIANKMKAKGLQKLRWYCQMCQKQCRDENGFKCHVTSEGHQRQLLLFADSPGKFISEFSREFEHGFMELLRRQYGTKRVQANRVYQEYISNKNHLHMNSTQWVTLTGFIKYLGKTGKCVVDETEKGWFITYVDRDPLAIQEQEASAKKEKMHKDDNERMMSFLQKQIKSGKKRAAEVEVKEPTELKKPENEKLTLKLFTKPLPPKPTPIAVPTVFKNQGIKIKKDPKKTEKRELTAIEAIIKEEQEQKRRRYK